MDWTDIYSETGEEDIFIPRLLESHSTAPRLSRMVSKRYFHIHIDTIDEDFSESSGHRLMELAGEAPTSSDYNLRALYYLTINYILGVGCLGVPHAFARAGFILCGSILLTVTLLSYMTVLWVAETGARIELHQQSKSQDTIISEQSALLRRCSSHESNVDESEVIDLVGFFLGRVHKFLYHVSLMALMYIGLLAYTQVFCGAIAALLWSSTPQGVPQIVFGMLVVPLSCVDLDEQVSVQSIMATVRFVAMFIMIGGSLLALFLDDAREDATHDHPPFFAPSEPKDCQMSYTACFSGFGVAFSTALFSQLFQHSVPGLLRPLKDRPDKLVQAPRVFGASLFTTCSFYLLLGTTAASYFGADTMSSINLNFAPPFLFGFNPETTPRIVKACLKFASGVVVIFPALDTISVFPLIANTLGNNLLNSAGPSFVKWISHRLPFLLSVLSRSESPTRRFLYSDLSSRERKSIMRKSSKIATIFWRLVSALPPLLASLFATELTFSLLLAGVAGVYVAFFAPALLQLKSRRLVPEQVMFVGWWSSPWLPYPVLLFATFSLGMVLVQIRDAVLAMMS